MTQESSERDLFEPNLSRDPITFALADIIARLMRGAVAQNSSNAAFQAGQEMERVIGILASQADKRSWYSLFLAALEILKDTTSDDGDNHYRLRAAKDGTKYLVESFYSNGLANARQAKALSNFQESAARISNRPR